MYLHYQLSNLNTEKFQPSSDLTPSNLQSIAMRHGSHMLTSWMKFPSACILPYFNISDFLLLKVCVIPTRWKIQMVQYQAVRSISWTTT